MTFLSYDARLALLDRLAVRGGPGPDEPLLVPADRARDTLAAVEATSTALIGAGNDVNVSLCRATGDFFRAWGMPGARFEERAASSARPSDRSLEEPA